MLSRPAPTFYTLEYRSVYDDPVPAERHEADAQEAMQRIERLKPFLGEDVSLLEIGSGSCAFLKNVSGVVKEAVGVEMDQASREWFSTISDTAVYQNVEDVDQSKKFDLIVMFHVLEHLSDPVAFLGSGLIV